MRKEVFSEKDTQLSYVDHIALSVADIDQSVAWYLTSFNCEVLFSNKKEALLQFGNIKLALHLPSQQPAHVGFIHSEAHTYGELSEKQDGSNSCFVSDPTGNVVELISSKA